jgi:hypothetical protein
VEGRGENAGGAEADKEGEEQARGEEVGPAPAAGARSPRAASRTGNATDSASGVAGMRVARVTDIVSAMRMPGAAVREAADRHDAESHHACRERDCVEIHAMRDIAKRGDLTERGATDPPCGAARALYGPLCKFRGCLRCLSIAFRKRRHGAHR